MNTHALVVIVAALAVSGCERHSGAVQQGQTPTSVATSAALVGRYQAVAMPRGPGTGLDSVLIWILATGISGNGSGRPAQAP